MIHLDTNALIALPKWSRAPQHPVIERVLSGEPAAACSLVWYEYCTGPLVDGEVERARAFLEGGIPPVTSEDASLAARLFNVAGRARRLKTDALVAAAAIHASADLATINVVDFQPFVEHGLRLISVKM